MRPSIRLLPAGCLLAAIVLAPTVAAAQPSAVVKTWDAQGVWKTSLVKRSREGYICMLTALGKEPHAFGAMFMAIPGRLLFAVDDRTEGLRYLPTMTVTVDDQQVATYPTFNDPPMTSTAPSESAKVKALIARMGAGKTLTVDARHTRYSVSLDGFATAAGQLAACRNEMAKLAQSGSTQ